MQGEWIKRPKGATSVVFVHGILSSGEDCWRHENGSYWPELLKNESELEALGIYVFTYQTDIFSGTYRLGDVVDSLKEHMRLDGLFDSQRIIFVCHSMGGIVVRKFLVERDTDLIEKKIEIGLFLVASPSLGSSYANWLSPLAQFFGHAQADALSFEQDNAWLNDLDKEFQNLKEAGKLRIKGKELIEDKFIVLMKFLRKQVVEPFSGARYFGEPFKVPKSDHFSIAKPQNKDAIQHRLLTQFIKSMLEVSVRSPTREAETPEHPPTIIIDGPPTAPLGKTTHYTVISQNAVRGEWSVGGFQKNELFVIEPLGPSHQIFIEPTDAKRVGDSFTIVFTVYGPSGKSASARKQFLVVSEGAPLTSLKPRPQIAGTWESSMYGVMQLKQEGNRVFGAYDYSRQDVGYLYGQLEGEIDERYCKLTWCQDTSKQVPCEKRKWQGDGYFILSEDGNRLEGKWRFKGEQEWRAEWNLKRK